MKKNNESLEEIRRAINKKLGCLGHELDDIFDEAPKLKEVLNIIKVKRINNKTNKDVFIDEFRFIIENDSGDKKTIRIKNLEASRYGLFAKNRDIGGNSSDDMKNIVYFLNKLFEETGNIRAKMINEFDKNNKI